MEGRRTFNKVLGLFLFRTVVFSCAHVVFCFIKHPRHGDWWSMSDIIALSSCCWLILTLNLGIMEIFRYLWKMRRSKTENIDGKDDAKKADSKKNKERRKLCSILLIPQTEWYTLRSSTLLNENIEVKINNNNGNNREKEIKNSQSNNVPKNGGELVVTPWTLWYYVYAAGIGLFVLGFSINGLSLMSEASILLSSIIAISFIFRDEAEASFPLQYIASWGMGLSVGLVVIANIVNNPYMWGWRFLENMWMAVVLPVMSSVFLCKCGGHARDMNLTPEKILMFAMPSLAVMSAAFLSLYFPVSEQHSFYVQLQALFENRIKGLNSSDSVILRLSESLGYNQQATNETGNPGQQSPILFSLAAWANSTQIESIVNAERGFDMLMEKGNALSVISIILAPFMLWVVMVTVIGSVMRGVFNAQGAFSSYILVLAVKHFLLNGGDPWNIAALVVVVPSCIMTMVAETWKNSSFYTNYHFDTADRGGRDNDDEDEESETDDAAAV